MEREGFYFPSRDNGKRSDKYFRFFGPFADQAQCDRFGCFHAGTETYVASWWEQALIQQAEKDPGSVEAVKGARKVRFLHQEFADYRGKKFVEVRKLVEGNAPVHIETVKPVSVEQPPVELMEQPAKPADEDGVERVTAYRCVECGAISEDYVEKLYECPNCGTLFTRDNSADGMSHRCPDCGKFGSKIADTACAECEQGEAEEIEAFRHDACEELHETPDELRSCESESSEGPAAPQEKSLEGFRVGDRVVAREEVALHSNGLPDEPGSEECRGPAQVVAVGSRYLGLRCLVHQSDWLKSPSDLEKVSDGA